LHRAGGAGQGAESAVDRERITQWSGLRSWSGRMLRMLLKINAVCGWRGQKLSLITVYVPKPPKFIDPWTRGKKYGKEEM